MSIKIIMNYKHLRHLLFQLPAETTHSLSLKSINVAYKTGLLKMLAPKVIGKPKTVMGLKFDNPVGVAAGLDKDAAYINALGSIGFGFIEVGTITPLPQIGNPGTRIFRLPAAKAIINRLGFNSKGLEQAIANIKKRKYNGILGINIGKNMQTNISDAIDDYKQGLIAVYEYADYITINISSPNTPDLRELQFGDYLTDLLAQIQQQKLELQQQQQRNVPIAVKIAPDINTEQLKAILDTVVATQMDAIIATNTTVSRTGVKHLPNSEQQGGLSGAPLLKKSNQIIKQARKHLGKDFAIIGVGGITCGADAAAKIVAGADLVQFYTGFVYEGPQLLADCINAIEY